MKQALLDFVHSRQLIQAGDRVLIALSGGADSTCLLHLLKATGFDVAAAHLHHSQRPEGDADVDHCRALCESLDVPLYLGRANVPEVARTHKIGLEEAGRKLRYEFLQMIAGDGFKKIATGHTMDDNFETMLLNLCRGAGMRGLSGIPAARDNIVRPILFLRRRQTEAYCEENNLEYLHDSCNFDPSFARNRLRQTVVPVLESLNANSVEHAFATASVLAEEDRLLNGLVIAHLSATEVVSEHPLAFIQRRIEGRWNRPEHLPLAIVRRCVRSAIGMYGGDLGGPALASLAAAILDGSKASFTAEGGTVAVSCDHRSWKVRVLDDPQPFREILTIPGETIADDLGWSLAAWHGKSEIGPLAGSVDADKLKGDLFARSLKRGDKINPRGRGVEKSLSDRLARAGVSEAVRHRLPIVCDMLGPVWAPMVGLDCRVAMGAETKRPLALRLAPIDAVPSGT